MSAGRTRCRWQISRNCIELGFSEVQTYINSGNVLFSSTSKSKGRLTKSIETAIEKRFGFPVPVCIISAPELIASMANAPSWWGTDTEARHDAFFVLPSMTPRMILEQIGEINPQYEKIAYSGQVMFWSANLKMFSRTQVQRLIGTKAYANITVRNANTARKLLALVQAGEQEG